MYLWHGSGHAPSQGSVDKTCIVLYFHVMILPQILRAFIILCLCACITV